MAPVRVKAEVVSHRDEPTDGEDKHDEDDSDRVQLSVQVPAVSPSIYILNASESEPPSFRPSFLPFTVAGPFRKPLNFIP